MGKDNQLPVRVDLRDRRFGRLRVISLDGFRQYKIKRQYKWKCICDCGREASVQGSSLIAGLTKSCGCFRKETTVRVMTTHGHATNGTTPEYRAWAAMRNRCSFSARGRNKKYYYDRGIRVCKRWVRFESFIKDMGKRSLDSILVRIDTSKGYAPSNCKWGRFADQINNTSRNVFYPYKGARKTISQLSRISGSPYDLISNRIRRGWSVSAAVETPKRKK